MGVHQVCDCTVVGRVRVGDEVVLETETEPVSLTVQFIETFRHSNGVLSDVVSLGLCGEDADWIMPGDTLAVTLAADRIAVESFAIV